MAERPPIDTSLRRGRGLQPVAYPNQQGVPLGRDPDAARLSQLAQGLSEIAPALQRYGRLLMDQQDERTKAQAREDAQREFASIRDAQKEYSEARASGEIRANQDPFYLKYYDDTMGMLLAQHYFSDWTEASRPALKSATSLAEYDAAHAQFIDARIEEMFAEEEVPEAFLTSWSQLLAGDRRAWAAEAAARLKGQVDEQAFAIGHGIARQALSARQEVGDVVANLRMAIDQRFSLEGAELTTERRAVIGQTFVKGFLDGLAQQARNPDFRDRASVLMLDVLGNLPWGPGSVAIGVHAISELVKDTEARIRANEAEADTRRKRDSNNLVGEVSHNIIGMAIDPATSGDDLRAAIAQAYNQSGDLHPDAVQGFRMFLEDVSQVRGSMDRLDEGEDNEEWISGWYDQALAPGASLASLSRSLVFAKNAGQLKNDTFATLYRFADSLFGTGGDRTKKFFSSEAWSQAESYIANILKSQATIVQAILKEIPAGQAQVEARAHVALANFAMEWIQANPDASEQEALLAMTDRAKTLVQQAALQWPDPQLRRALLEDIGKADPEQGGVMIDEPTLPLLGTGNVGRQNYQMLEAISQRGVGIPAQQGPMDALYQTLSVLQIDSRTLDDPDELRRFLAAQARFYGDVNDGS